MATGVGGVGGGGLWTLGETPPNPPWGSGAGLRGWRDLAERPLPPHPAVNFSNKDVLVVIIPYSSLHFALCIVTVFFFAGPGVFVCLCIYASFPFLHISVCPCWVFSKDTVTIAITITIAIANASGGAVALLPV